MCAESKEVDQICGVPYTALPIATIISVESNIPMLIRRKEAKSYGTKKLIEGSFKSGDNCVIIEDVVTSGSSILETVSDLRKEGLIVTEAYIIVDREQGGKQNIENSGIRMKSLFTLTQLMQYLLESGKVTAEDVTKVVDYLKEHSAPAKSIEKGIIFSYHFFHFYGTYFYFLLHLSHLFFSRRKTLPKIFVKKKM